MRIFIFDDREVDVLCWALSGLGTGEAKQLKRRLMTELDTPGVVLKRKRGGKFDVISGVRDLDVVVVDTRGEIESVVPIFDPKTAGAYCAQAVVTRRASKLAALDNFSLIAEALNQPIEDAYRLGAVADVAGAFSEEMRRFAQGARHLQSREI